VKQQKEIKMDFLNISGFNVLAGKNREFQTWVRANTPALARAMPQGVELVGIYACIFTSEKQSGAYKMVWRLDSYGAMDRLVAAAGENPELARLMDELGKFYDVRLGADWSNELLKAVADATIWSDYPEG
jgi:hypothetical protein